MAKNVLGTELKSCCTDPMTGYYRTGKCETGPEDYGNHSVCVEVTQPFLIFSKGMGNDLSTPNPHYGFPGLKPGDKWCLCAIRWLEAHQVGVAPKIFLESTHERALEVIPIEILKKHGRKKSGTG